MKARSFATPPRVADDYLEERQGLRSSSLIREALPIYVHSDSNSEWGEFVAAVTSSNGSSAIIRRAMCTSKWKAASLLDD